MRALASFYSSRRCRNVALAKHASAFTQGNDLPWNPAKHYSILKVLNKLPEVYHIRRGLSSNKGGLFIPDLKAPCSLAPFCNVATNCLPAGVLKRGALAIKTT